jgi:hypothetical protein
VACGQSSSAAEQQSSRAPACDGNQRTRELEAGGMDWRAAHRHGDTTGTTLGHSLASLAHTAGPPGARRLALTGPRLGAFIFDAVPCKKRLVRAKIAARFPTPRRSCDRRRRASSCVVVRRRRGYRLPTMYASTKCPTSANGRRAIASAARPAVST